MNQQDQQFWEQCAIAAMHGMYSISNIDFGTKEDVSRIAFDGADAMLAERNKRLKPTPNQDGWIDWNGGDIPVSKTEFVEVRFRDKSTDSGFSAGCYEWGHMGESYDIIAYKVVDLR